MYTLEKHLQQCCIENPTFEILNSIWHLNKKHIPSAQATISQNFPHFSLHEQSHSETIIKNIESFLGDERIKQLSPTDAWLILMVSYTHDLGMVVYDKVSKEVWISEKFQEYLTVLSTGTDKDLKEAAILLINLKERASDEANKLLPLQIRKAVTLVNGEYFRRIHWKRSKDLIRGDDDEFYQHIQKFHLDTLPNRFTEILADIAYCHGDGFYPTIDRMEYSANGYGNDKMHPRFIACLLRLGDLLDVDDNRFNTFNENVLLNGLPHTSQLHKEKHAAVKHLLISPESIEVTVDCQTDEVYRVTRQWFDWLQEEVEDQSREWTIIAPPNLSGIPPVISRGKIKVLYQSTRPPEDLMNLRFTIANKKIFEIIEGGAIYESGSVFIREIIQNALDASKIQLWTTICSGVYNFLLKEYNGLNDSATHEEIIASIKFPKDLPPQIWDNFPIEMSVVWKDEKKDILQFCLIDKGCGISVDTLIRMTKKVGEGRKADDNFQKFIKTMPYWLKPTGAFGIGLQSIFLVSDSFKMETKTEFEEAKEIIFSSAKNGEYCKVTTEKPNMQRGTKVTVEVKEQTLSSLFYDPFTTAAINNFDIFNDTYSSIYLQNTENHIIDNFGSLNTLCVNFLGKQIKKVSKPSEIQGFKLQKSLEKDKILVNMYVSEYDFIRNLYVVEEYLEIGSKLTIEFSREYTMMGSHFESNYRYLKPGYSVRGILTKEELPKYIFFTYCYIHWDFQSHESDKILNLSRDKFIPQVKRDYTNKLLSTIFPKILKYIIELFKQRINANKNSLKLFALEFFSIELTSLMVNQEPSKLLEHFAGNQIPTAIVTNYDESAISFKDFFEADTYMTISKVNQNIEKAESLEKAFNRLRTTHTFNTDMIVWNTSYLFAYLEMSDYQLKEMYTIIGDNGEMDVIRIFKKSNDFISVKCDQASKEILLKRLDNANSENYNSNRRDIILPLAEYSNILAVAQPFDGFHTGLRSTKHYIISPFRKDWFIEAKKQLAVKGLEKSSDAMKSFVEINLLPQLLPDKLVNFILENSSSPDKENLTKEKIFKAYLELVTEALLVSYKANSTL